MRVLFSMTKEKTKGGRITKWLVSGPPLLFLLVFFVAPSLIMIVTSFRYPGEFGGLAPLVAPAGEVGGEYGLTLEAYQFFLSSSLYAEIFLSGRFQTTPRLFSRRAKSGSAVRSMSERAGRRGRSGVQSRSSAPSASATAPPSSMIRKPEIWCSSAAS